MEMEGCGYNLENWEKVEWCGPGKGEDGVVDDSQISDLSKGMEGILLFKVVKNGEGVLWRQEGITDLVLGMVHFRYLQNSQGKEKPWMHLQNESGKEIRAEL